MDHLWYQPRACARIQRDGLDLSSLFVASPAWFALSKNLFHLHCTFSWFWSLKILDHFRVFFSDGYCAWKLFLRYPETTGRSFVGTREVHLWNTRPCVLESRTDAIYIADQFIFAFKCNKCMVPGLHAVWVCCCYVVGYACSGKTDLMYFPTKRRPALEVLVRDFWTTFWNWIEMYVEPTCWTDFRNDFLRKRLTGLASSSCWFFTAKEKLCRIFWDMNKQRVMLCTTWQLDIVLIARRLIVKQLLRLNHKFWYHSLSMRRLMIKVVFPSCIWHLRSPEMREIATRIVQLWENIILYEKNICSLDSCVIFLGVSTVVLRLVFKNTKVPVF